eukprot:2675269-Rhodomonas_salina.3
MVAYGQQVCGGVQLHHSWTLEPDLTLPLRDHSLNPPIPLAIPDSADARYMIAIDEVQLVGAGITGYMPDFILFSFNVGGQATSQRGEMAAAARALNLSYPNLPLTIYTDCMTILNAVARWRRGDFQPRLEDKKHQDILLYLLWSLWLRAADTHFVWVAAHVGNPGNELVDIEANLGAQSEDRMWELNTFPIALHSTMTSTFPLLHAATWTPTVDQHAKNFVCQKQAEWLRNFSTARSTDFTLQDTNRCEILGKVLSDNSLPELVICDLLQARSFCFPTATVVSHNHSGSWSTKCCLCKAAVDTFAHRFMLCPELHGAQQTMHNDIA